MLWHATKVSGSQGNRVYYFDMNYFIREMNLLDQKSQWSFPANRIKSMWIKPFYCL